eukprot:8235519-Karenia_brevis.AAC.1
MVLFRTLDGTDIRLAVNPAQRLVDVQVALTEECACAFPENIARLVKPNGDLIANLFEFPFEDCREDDVFTVVLSIRGAHEELPERRVEVDFRLPSGQHVEEVVITTETRLRDVQRFLIHLAGGCFASDRASLSSADGNLFNDLDDLPFIRAKQGDLFTAFINPTYGPFFFDSPDRRLQVSVDEASSLQEHEM